MMISKNYIKTGLIALALAVLFSPITVIYAEDGTNSLSDQQLQHIKDNCLSAKSSLSQLRVSDALLRVNMGQIYEALSTKLMSGFNGRVSSNGLDNSSLTSVSDDYKTALETFRSDYLSYESQLSDTIGIDCSVQPEVFYNSLVSARLKRQKVYTDVKNLNQYLDDYKSAVTKFETDFLSTSTTSGSSK